jgi:hypothetical protein
MAREEHNVETKLMHPNDGEQGVILVFKGDKCNNSRGMRNSRSRVGSNARAKWKHEEKRWKINICKSTTSTMEWGGMGRSGIMCNS